MDATDHDNIDANTKEYGEIQAFNSNTGIVQGEAKGWKYRRGGLMTKKGWQWVGNSSKKDNGHWRAWDVVTNNNSKLPVTEYYWFGPNQSTTPPPLPSRPRHYTYSILQLTPPLTWTPAPLGEFTQKIADHNRHVKLLHEGGKRRTKRRTRRRSKRFSISKK